jgi:arylsulfatase A-like enzyme
LSCYGYTKNTTPNIDKIASEGTLYKNAISASPWTLPSHASIFTGLYPSEHNTHSKHGFLDSEYPTLTENLTRLGYTTAGFSNNPYVSAFYGLSRGFNEFELIHSDKRLFTNNSLDIHSFVKNNNYKGIKKYLKLIIAIFQEGNPLKNIFNILYIKFQGTKIKHFLGDDDAGITNKKIKSWIKKNHNNTPFFIFVNYMECHVPYSPPFKYRKNKLTFWRDLKINQDSNGYNFKQFELSDEEFKILESLYDAEQEYLDHKIGEIYKFLIEEGILEDTILIITSDHGENIGDHGLFGHILCVYDTVVHVPLIIRYPKRFPVAKRVKQRVQSHDIFKTIMDIIDKNNNIEGYSLLPESIENNPERIVISELMGLNVAVNLSKAQEKFPDVDVYKYDFGLKAIYLNKYKYIKNLDNGQNELYVLSEDPDEKTNVIKEHPNLEKILDETISNWVESIEHKKNIKLKIKELKRIGRI